MKSDCDRLQWEMSPIFESWGIWRGGGVDLLKRMVVKKRDTLHHKRLDLIFRFPCNIYFNFKLRKTRQTC